LDAANEFPIRVLERHSVSFGETPFRDAISVERIITEEGEGTHKTRRDTVTIQYGETFFSLQSVAAARLAGAIRKALRDL